MSLLDGEIRAIPHNLSLSADKEDRYLTSARNISWLLSRHCRPTILANWHVGWQK